MEIYHINQAVVHSSWIMNRPCVWDCHPQSGDPALVTGDYITGHITTCDMFTGKFIKLIGVHPCITSVSTVGTRVVSGASDGSLIVWTGDSRMTLVGHEDSIVSCCGESTLLVSWSYDGQVKTWNLTTGACLYTTNRYGHSTNCSISCGGTTLASPQEWCKIVLEDVRTGKYIKTLPGTASVVGCLYSPTNATQLAVVYCDDTIRVWNTRTATYHTIRKQGHMVTFSSDGSKLITASPTGSNHIQTWLLSVDIRIFAMIAIGVKNKSMRIPSELWDMVRKHISEKYSLPMKM